MKSRNFSLILFGIFLIASLVYLFKEDAVRVSFYMGLSIINFIAAVCSDLKSKS